MAKLARQLAKKAKQEKSQKIEKAVGQVLNKMEYNAYTQGVQTAIALFCFALRESEGFGQTRIKRVTERVDYYTQAMESGHLKIEDIMKTLEDEVQITFRE